MVSVPSPPPGTGPEQPPGPSPLDSASHVFLVAGQTVSIPGPLKLHGVIFSSAAAAVRLLTLQHGQDGNAPIFALLILITQGTIVANFSPPDYLERGLFVDFSSTTCYVTISYTPLPSS
jgi:hypothetical protein